MRIHPQTGERALLLEAFLKQFVGVGSSESRRLYEIFQAHVKRLENKVLWRWRDGDVAISDNRATQYYAIDDHGDAKRALPRVTIKGVATLGVDGRRGLQLRPEKLPDLRAI